MAQPCCPSPINPCVDPASPVTNYSSEGDDIFTFPGRSYPEPPTLDGGPGDPPQPPFVPHGPNDPNDPCAWSWNAGVIFGSSETSLELANIDAHNRMVDCISLTTPTPTAAPQPPKIDMPPTVNNPPTIEDGGGRTGGGQPPRPPQKKCNDEIEICEIPCGPYGTFKYQVAKGQVCAFTQEQANQQAASLACLLALQNRICLPPIHPIAWCVDNSYETIIDSGIEGATLGEGTLKPGESGMPPGLAFHNASEMGGNKRAGIISGTPTGTGMFCFEMVAVIPNLLASQRTYCIAIFDIDCPTATARAGQDYADIVELLGPIGIVRNQTCDIIAGSLPPGLTLNHDTCVISGHIPIDTTPATYDFTLEVCFDATVQGQIENRCCQKICSITVLPANCPDWTLLDWGPFTTELHGTGTVANGSSNENHAQITASTPGGPGPQEFWGIASFGNDFVYDGPGCGAKLRLNLTIDDPASAQVTITKGTDTIFDTGAVAASGNYTFLFDMPPSAMVTYHIFFGVSVGSIGVGPPWEPGSISALATLEWQ